MKELQIGSKVVRIRATPLSLIYYKQEFKKDLVGDLLKMFQSLVGVDLMKNADKISTNNFDIGSLDVSLFLQLTWAMAKADSYGKEFPSFEKWVSELEEFDLFSNDLITDVIAEASDGFFRGRGNFIAPSAK